MSNHTPGPWSVAEDFCENGLIESLFGNVAVVHGFGNPDDETRPNANLIAAAPDLLAACKAVVDRSGGRLYNTDQVTGSIFADLLSAAIARAEGGAA